MKKGDSSLIPLEEHLIKLVEDYEAKHWSDIDSITDDQVEESDLAEMIVRLRNQFIQKIKERIKKY